MGITPSGPVEANRGARARVRAAGKALERDDRHTMIDRQILRPLHVYDDCWV